MAKEVDAEKIAHIGAKTFFETYSEENIPENMEKYIKKAFSLSTIKKALKDKNSIFFIAEENKTIGYAKLKINKKESEIERLYILKDYLGRGIGKKLMEQCVETSKKKACTTIWVQVWGDKYNAGLKAIEFYKDWGFEKFGKKVFKLGDSEQEDILMKKELE